jgi:hypothetical protein
MVREHRHNVQREIDSADALDHVARPPTPAMTQAARSLAAAAQQFNMAQARVRGLGRWEAELQARALLLLAMRNVETVSLLAGWDQVLLPAAVVSARTAFELSVRSRWLLVSDDRYEGEVRWLAMIREAEDTYRRQANRLEKAGYDVQYPRDAQKSFRTFRLGVEDKLPAFYRPTRGLPKLDAMLDTLGEPEQYTLYIRAPHYVHGLSESTGIYHRNLGTARTYGEFIKPRDWHLPLAMAWRALSKGGEIYIARAGNKSRTYPSRRLADTVERTLRQVLMSA